MTEPSTARLPRHIPSIDGLRAVSFLIVFVSHAGLGQWVPGGFGVTVFFFLSGFLITTLMRVEFENHGRVNLQHFWLRRMLRILPPFYAVLLLALAATMLLQPGATQAGPLAALALHYANYWMIHSGADGMPIGTGVYWSLAVEEHFYLAFPWLYLALQRLQLTARGQALVFWGLCLLVLAWRCVLVLLWESPADRSYMGSDTRVDSILYGCALAVWHNPFLDAPSGGERRWKYLALPAALALLGFCLVYRDPAFRETARYSLQGLALTVIFVCAIRYPQWWPFRALNTRLAGWIGMLSYSLYLLHYTVLEILEQQAAALHPLPRGLLALAIAIALAWVIYRFIERPCAALRRRLTD